jgi:hypothetical protein
MWTVGSIRELAARYRRVGSVHRAGATAVLISTLLLAAPPRAAIADEYIPVPTHFYGAASNLCLTSAGHNFSINVATVQWYCDSNPNNGWFVHPRPDGTTEWLQDLTHYLCLAPAGGGNTINTKVVLYNCDDDPSRLWNVVWNGNGYFLLNVNSGLCLSPAGGGTGINIVMVLYYCDNDPSRTWKSYVT